MVDNKTKEQYSVDLRNLYWNKERSQSNYIDFCLAVIGYASAHVEEVLESMMVSNDADRLARAVLSWSEIDDKMAEYGAGAVVDIGGSPVLVDEAWDDAKHDMVDLATEIRKDIGVV